MIHIVGAGPTGVTMAWDLARMGHEVHVWEKHDTCGGSWWEPDDPVPNLHASRVLFKNAFVNASSLFDEMGLDWKKYFVNNNVLMENVKLFWEKFSARDYFDFMKNFSKVMMDPERYKRMTLEEMYGGEANDLIKELPVAMDGVDWTRMTAWEFFQSINTTLVSTTQTQRVSGREMGLDMEDVLRAVGVVFHFGQILKEVHYEKESYQAVFESGRVIGDGYLILAMDPWAAKKVVKTNWGLDAHKKLSKIEYHCVNIVMKYDGNIPPNTRDTIYERIRDGHVSCMFFNPPAVPPEKLVEMTGIKPEYWRLCWGSKWNGVSWEFEQSSGIYSPDPIPFWGECVWVALVGTMSPRSTPYASIESAVEVARHFVHSEFDGPSPKKPFTLIFVLIVFLFIIIYIYGVQT